MIENIRQGDENQVRAAVRRNAKRKAGWENNQTRGERNKCIQDCHIDRFTQQGAALTNVASKNRHRANAQRQRKERLVHRADNDIDNASFLHPVQVRNQVELQSLACAFRQDAVHRQNHHDRQQREHHHLGHTLQAALQSKRIDCETHNDDNDHPAPHHKRLAKHFGKYCLHLFGRRPFKPSGSGQIEIMQHPSAHGRVKHHQQVVANHGQITVDMPFLPRLFQRLISAHRTFLTGAAHRKFHRHNRQPQDD